MTSWRGRDPGGRGDDVFFLNIKVKDIRMHTEHILICIILYLYSTILKTHTRSVSVCVSVCVSVFLCVRVLLNFLVTDQSTLGSDGSLVHVICFFERRCASSAATTSSSTPHHPWHLFLQQCKGRGNVRIREVWLLALHHTHHCR